MCAQFYQFKLTLPEWLSWCAYWIHSACWTNGKLGIVICSNSMIFNLAPLNAYRRVTGWTVAFVPATAIGGFTHSFWPRFLSCGSSYDFCEFYCMYVQTGTFCLPWPWPWSIFCCHTERRFKRPFQTYPCYHELSCKCTPIATDSSLLTYWWIVNGYHFEIVFMSCFKNATYQKVSTGSVVGVWDLQFDSSFYCNPVAVSTCYSTWVLVWFYRERYPK